MKKVGIVMGAGIPEGICTVDRRASTPSKALDFMGIPITGRVVFCVSPRAHFGAYRYTR